MSEHLITRRQLLRYVALGTSAGLLAACQPKIVEVTKIVEKEVEKEVTKIVKQVVKETVIVEGTPQVVEKEVTRVIEKVATPVAEEITLAVWNIWGGARVPMMDDMFKRFSEVHPGLKVENVLSPGGERLQKIQVAIAGGTPPDVPMINQNEVPMFASQKALIPLDSYMALDGVGYDEYYDYAIAASQWEGKTYTLPNCSACWALYFYNTEHYEEVGLDPSNPPTVWDELIDVSKKLTVMEGDTIKRLGHQFYHGLPNYEDFWFALYSNQGKYISDDGRTVTFNGPEGLEAAQFLLRAAKEIYGKVEAYQDWGAVQGELDITNPFISGTLSSRMGGVWEIFYIMEGKPDLPYLLGLVPGTKDGGSHQGVGGSWSYGIPVDVRHPDASWELVEWLCHEPTVACWFMQQQGRPSPMIACNEDQYYYDTCPNTWPVVVKSLANAIGYPITPAHSEMVTRLTQALEEMCFGVTTPEQALEWAATECQALLDEAWAKL